ncbi:hypothetical protein ACFQFC_33000 [Amorphoplanes digitatis]|uniref:Uncharacterized protein n=1 Tax=Actinoplanes digitatis TaxID=1868 RepID=A0A7W7HUF2_9ACTN|nr:hypothetical protein [Actinoplanes digitatis]MBB4760977.1 hypothetical protein [Actinoplanes digitatis]BFE69290.1 hypothetical protein GCM10020092_025910 [Actinoplanes digitatis]GID95286.1 hypothetical protein Adi01nite_46980 [Actinoplanes digitatis]
MKQTIKRLLAIAVALISVATASPAQAVGAQPPPQRLHATAYYGTLDVIAREVLNLRTRITTLDGRPVPGLPVSFVTTGERWFMCEATTDWNGVAECRNGPIPPPISLANLLVNGYDAIFSGNRWFRPVMAHNNIGIG